MAGNFGHSGQAAIHPVAAVTRRYRRLNGRGRQAGRLQGFPPHPLDGFQVAGAGGHHRVRQRLAVIVDQDPVAGQAADIDTEKSVHG